MARNLLTITDQDVKRIVRQRDIMVEELQNMQERLDALNMLIEGGERLLGKDA